MRLTRTLGLLAAAAAVAGLAQFATTGAQAEDEIVLGSAISLTGKYSTNGDHTKNGYDLAVERINAQGGVKVGDKTYKLKIVYYDDESTPARGAQLVERLISQDGVKFLLGPYSSGMTKAIAPVTEKYGVPMVEANGAARSLFTQGYKYIFAVLNSSDQYLSSAVDLIAEAAEKQGRDPSSLKLAATFENDPFSQDVRVGIVEAAEKHGMKLVIDDQLPPELNDMSATLTKSKALRPDAMFVSGHSKGAALGVRQISEMRVDVSALAMTHCDAADIIGKFGKAAEYTLCASQWHPSLTYSDPLFGSAGDYAKTFEEKYGYAPPYQAAESSAAVQVWADAFARAGSLEPDAVRDALAATDMVTFYGPVKFDETGKNVAKSMVQMQVQNGEYVVVAPSKWATADFVYPMPAWSARDGS